LIAVSRRAARDPRWRSLATESGAQHAPTSDGMPRHRPRSRSRSLGSMSRYP
jgi:hypothetical protein